MQSDIETTRAARWRLLVAVRKGGYIGLSEAIIIDTLRALFARHATQGWVRDHMDYLEREDMLTIERHAALPWYVHLTGAGYEFVDYIAPDHIGIARPPRPWSDS